uniref:Uncharacterized protein n=1 Tax=Syphacia muris TaxID=451379 RepID=A0A0N5ABJ4_9BILA
MENGSCQNAANCLNNCLTSRICQPTEAEAEAELCCSDSRRHQTDIRIQFQLLKVKVGAAEAAGGAQADAWQQF